MAGWTLKEGQKSLAAISTLKRALGIRNHPTKIDEIIGTHCQVYVQDKESADLIAELLYQLAKINRQAYFDTHHPANTIGKNIEVHPLDEEGFQISARITYAPSFTKGLARLTEKHISPDTGFTR